MEGCACVGIFFDFVKVEVVLLKAFSERVNICVVDGFKRNFNKNIGGFTGGLFKEIALNFKRIGICKIRLNIPLLNGAVNTVSKRKIVVVLICGELVNGRKPFVILAAENIGRSIVNNIFEGVHHVVYGRLRVIVVAVDAVAHQTEVILKFCKLFICH